VKQWLPDLKRPRTITILRWAIGIVLLIGVLAFLVQGANNPKDPYLDTNSLPSGSLVRAVGSSLALPSPTSAASLSHPVGMM
jgi:hypothetical protein